MTKPKATGTPVVKKAVTPPVVDATKPPVETETPAPVAPVTPPVETPEPTTPPENDTPALVELSTNLKRPELNEIALEAGLVNVEKYKTKDEVIAAVNRVRGGEDASAVDKELTPVVDDGNDTVEVEAIAPFYDLAKDTSRTVGQKFKVSETRAAELRGHKLIK